MIIETIVVGPLQVNCYVVGDEETKAAIIVDPGDDAHLVLRAIERHGLKATRIVNTHCHFDHVGGVKALKEQLGVKFYIHKDEQIVLKAATASALLFGMRVLQPEADDFVAEGDTVNVGKLALRVFHTPGHSPGHICLVGDQVAFVGDVLFAGGIGRFDFPGSSYEALMDSIHKLLTLDDATVVYPGHGPATTIGREKKTNPFLV